MRKIALLTAVLSLTFMGAQAQYVTYNQDSPKRNQIMVMETGGGTLTPSLYYTLLHNSYRKSAVRKNKLVYRTEAGMMAYGQVEYADSIESALTKRAEIEALNMADREIDLAWNAEGKKITSQMEKMQKNIDRILTVGGTPTDKERWSEYYNVYNCAINATKDAYMPNAQRKKEYLRIYDDLTKQNETLIKYLVQLHSRSQTNNLLSATYELNTNKGNIITSAKERWNTAKQKSQPTTRRDDSYSSSDGNEADEMVNR